MGFIILCARELLGDISSLLSWCWSYLQSELLAQKLKTHPAFYQSVWCQQLSWRCSWLNFFLKRHFHCLISGPCSNSCLRFHFWICLQPTAQVVLKLVDRGPLLKVKLKGGLQGIRDYQRLASHNSSNFGVSFIAWNFLHITILELWKYCKSIEKRLNMYTYSRNVSELNQHHWGRATDSVRGVGVFSWGLSAPREKPCQGEKLGREQNETHLCT